MRRPRRPAGGDQPPVDVRQFFERIAAMRQIRWFRTSSAFVRWVMLVVAVGFGAALLTALMIAMLVSLIPRSGG